MKKVMLLSVVASGLIYAGGDIAPVAPVAPKVAPAACDFYGDIGFKFETKGKSDDLFKKASNKFEISTKLGVNKQIGYGFGLGAEIKGKESTKDFKKISTSSEFTKLFLTYKTGNTEFTLGRQALPKSLSPWAYSDDSTYEGLVVKNTDLSDTTLVGAWIATWVDNDVRHKVNGKNNSGLLMGAVEYKGIANTTLRGTLYYVTKAKTVSAWASAETKLDAAKLGLQVAYVKADAAKKSYAVAGYAGTSFSGLNVKLTGAYADITKNSPLSATGNDDVAVWGEGLVGSFGNTTHKVKLVRLDADYKVGSGKLYSAVGYETEAKEVGAKLGYKFKINKISTKVEYKYNKVDKAAATHKIKVEAKYKF